MFSKFFYDEMDEKRCKEKTMLRIIYLFLSSENKINDADYSLFEETGKSIEGFLELKGGIIEECEKVLSGYLLRDTMSRYEIVSWYFSTCTSSSDYFYEKQKQLKEEYEKITDPFLRAGAIKKSAFQPTFISQDESRAILWTLIKLFRSIENKSEKKQQLIDLWVETNQIDKSIALEMIDTCETENALLGFNNWLETNKSYQDVNSIKQELEKNQVSLKESVNNLIVLG